MAVLGGWAVRFLLQFISSIFLGVLLFLDRGFQQDLVPMLNSGLESREIGFSVFLMFPASSISFCFINSVF